MLLKLGLNQRSVSNFSALTMCKCQATAKVTKVFVALIVHGTSVK